MQLITLLSTAAAVATVSARTAVSLNKECNLNKPYARVINRCPYPVNIWSVFKGAGCPGTEAVTLQTGEIYSENYEMATDDNEGQGVSIKISKTQECKGNDITQLEYFLDNRNATEKPFRLNYLDVSYVDCKSDCPTKQEGYYLTVGSPKAKAAKVAADGSWCPILACHDAASCAKMSYILPDDVQTKTCDLESSMDFYMCGSEAPGDEAPASSAPASSSKKAATSVVKPSTTLVPVVSSAAYKVKAAAVTPIAKIDDSAKGPKVKTKVVYVTAYEYVNAKRHEHAHAHARRHQPFNA